MALKQTILFTVMPRGISVDSERLPVSVFVSPRLEAVAPYEAGEDRLKLGAFGDWVDWTGKLAHYGLEFDFRCGDGQPLTVPIDRAPLRPDLWEELFKPETLVRSHTFDDYGKLGIISYPVRQALSALKAIYQQASVSLALPDNPNWDPRERSNRLSLTRLVEGLNVHWEGCKAQEWRQSVRITGQSGQSLATGVTQQALDGPLDREGMIVARPDAQALKKVAVPFSVFHHMPTPPWDELNIDPDTLLDFHQALSALNAYPELLRALGMVFDLDLPAEFVEQTSSGQYGTLVATARFGWDTALRPATPQLETAYLHFTLGERRLFLAAPRVTQDPRAPVTVMGLLNLDPSRFGLAQVDVDGAMHKAIVLAESLHPAGDHNLDQKAQPEPAPNPDVFDPGATLPALRSGGFSLFADARATHLLDTLTQSKNFNEAVTKDGKQPRPFFAEDLVRGYRLDVWDSHTAAWHSLHLREAEYQVGDQPFTLATKPEEGWVQLAATQPAKGATPETKDLYLHEAIARWGGWSLSAPMPAKHLSRYADAREAVPRPDDPQKFAEDQPVTPFKVTATYRVVPGSLPRLRFGARYRMRARAVDLGGNSLRLDDKLTDTLSGYFALPRDPEGFTYLRFEPVAAPLVIPRDAAAITSPGSAVDRLVIRTFNTEMGKDNAAADTTAADRHLVPPRASVEMGERLGMFDDANGRLKGDEDTWRDICQRDAYEFDQATMQVAGEKPDSNKDFRYPLDERARFDVLPYLPDLLARGAALRDLPGTLSGTIGKAVPGAGGADAVTYVSLSDPNPRPGSATMVGFGNGEWQTMTGFRFALAEPAPGQEDLRPRWDPVEGVLTVFLPKGQTKVVPLTSYMSPDDLKLMGVWQWLRQYVEQLSLSPQQQLLQPGLPVDRIAHVLQRAVEGGHWMLTPPRLLTLVHAVQQPLGRPEFIPRDVTHRELSPTGGPPQGDSLQTAPIRGRGDRTELAPITAWRRPGATDAFLVGALRIHGASTAKLDLMAEWRDPVDDPTEAGPATATHTASVEELPLKTLREGVLVAAGKMRRKVGHYDPENDQIVFMRQGDTLGLPGKATQRFDGDAAPRHLLNDTKRHLVTYKAVATSRFREYFEESLEFTRSSEPAAVDVPASARPLAPDVVYVVPTFGWERQTDTNLKRSVRFGGGLRVYLRRPWFSSGLGELLGVALWSGLSSHLDQDRRDKFKPFITQWGMDPIWRTGNLSSASAPSIRDFPDRSESDSEVSLEESSARDQVTGAAGSVDVVGFTPQFDEERRLWFADLTINLPSETYMPFVRLALVRYQPHALADAKISRVVLADFAQLTPDRSATVTSDPHHPRTLRVVVSGVAPRGPQAVAVVRGAEPPPEKLAARPTQITVRVQQRDPSVLSDLAWRDAAPTVVQVKTEFEALLPKNPDMEMWVGTVTFASAPASGRFRLLIEEREFISADYALLENRKRVQPGRVIYAETFELDGAMVAER